MNKRTLKIIKILLISSLCVAGVLNMLWPLDGFRWAYWISGFLLSSTVTIFGLSFLIFPKFMMHIYYEDEKDYKEDEARFYGTTYEEQLYYLDKGWLK